MTCEVNDTIITVLYSVDPSVPAEFSWIGANGFTHVGNRVHIPRKANDELIYFCTATNEVSTNSAEVNVKDCIAGNHV